MNEYSWFLMEEREYDTYVFYYTVEGKEAKNIMLSGVLNSHWREGRL